MAPNRKRLLLWGTIVSVLVLALFVAWLPAAELVDLQTVDARPLAVTVDAEGVTQVRDVFTVSAPLGGRLLRTPLRPGDRLVMGVTVVATLEPSDPAFLDPRALAESQQELQSAEAARTLAAAELARAEAEQTFATADLGRARELFAGGSVPRRYVDEAERVARMADATVAAAAAAVDARTHDVMRARVRLLTPVTGPRGADDCLCVTITAPVDGQVLQVFERSETVVTPGTPLLSVGDPAQLEVVADFLSADAVRISPGQTAWLDGWGGDRRLEGRVRRVEPFGFTKVSALGIEEQRVNVVIDLVSPRDAWLALGHGFRVVARVVTWESDAVLTVPVTALFRRDGRWTVFVAEAGRVRMRAVVPGQWAGLDVQILDGLSAGERIVDSPPAALDEGVRVRARDARPAPAGAVLHTDV
ncbi:MAG: HlyD family efflux transporter periplasmic adaptor subunit [Pseudomonadales bacterium]